MAKDLAYYMQLNYPIVLTPLSDDDGGGWLAEIPLLRGCMSDGETPEQALANVREAKEAWLAVATQRGQNIPEPAADEEQYSGKFTLRLPKSLHRKLALAARDEDVSLNQYVLSLISFGFGVKLAGQQQSAARASFYFYFNQPNRDNRRAYIPEMGENIADRWRALRREGTSTC